MAGKAVRSGSNREGEGRISYRTLSDLPDLPALKTNYIAPQVIY